MMVGSPGVGLMAVVAVSGSVLYVALKAHQLLVSDFMKRIEYELGHSGKFHVKKRVTFADDVVEPSSDNKAYRKGRSRKARQSGRSPAADGEESGERLMDISSGMPPNRVALYRGMREDRLMRGIMH